MAYVVIQVLLIVQACSLTHVQAQQTVSSQNGKCSTALNDTQVAYEGWFHRVKCNFDGFSNALNEHVPDWDSPDYINIEDDRLQCTISNWMTGEILFNKTVEGYLSNNLVMETYDVQAGSNRNIFQVELRLLEADKCQTQLVKLNVLKMKNERCSRIPEPISHTILKSIGRNVFMKCSGTDQRRVMFPKNSPLNSTNYEVKWLYNCSENLPSGVEVRGTALHFVSLSLQQPGIYTCAVSHNGQTRYVHSKLCVKSKAASSKPTLTCKETYFAKMGEDLTLECTAYLGSGALKVDTFLVAWLKNSNNFECQPDHLFLTNSRYNSKHACQNIVKNSGMKRYCHPLITEADELESKPAVTVQLLLRNINESDFGKYRVQVKSNAFHSKLVYIEVKENVSDKLLSRAEIIGLGIGICIFLFLVVGALCYFRFYVSYLIKLWFAPYEEDNKTYGAYLSYHFSTEIDTFAQQQIRDVSASIIDVLDRMGFRFYDECRDEVNGFRTENTINLMERSHRVIIVLTHQYVTDNWSVFHLQQGFMSVIESGSKLIFILPPGLKEYIKQHAPKDKTYRMIQRAIELNYAIDWSSEPNFNKRLFRMKLEHAMPKLPPVDNKRLPSSFSDDRHQKSGISRFLSNTTTTTEVFSEISEFADKE